MCNTFDSNYLPIPAEGNGFKILKRTLIQKNISEL